MRILVCGSEGRIMSAVIPLLEEAGHVVTGVDSCAKWGVQTRRRNYRFVMGDCSDSRLMKSLLRGVDGVIQGVATLYGVVGFHKKAADILTNDVSAHQVIVRLCAEARVQRVVYLSSSIVYEMVTKEPQAEESADLAPVPLTDYGLSKVIGERICKAFWTQYELPYTIWRPFNVLDPDEDGADKPGFSHVFADLIHRIIVRQQHPIEMLGDGNQVRSFVLLKEIAQAIAQFSFDDRTRNQTYNLGRSEVVTMKELATRIYKLAHDRGLVSGYSSLEFKSLPVPQTDVKRRVGNFEKAARELGWISKISLDEALAMCLDAFQLRTSTNQMTGGR